MHYTNHWQTWYDNLLEEDFYLPQTKEKFIQFYVEEQETEGVDAPSSNKGNS